MKSVLVFGDAILDRDSFLSPTGWVPRENSYLLRGHLVHDEYTLGGAGRVAAHIARHDCIAHYFTPYGINHASGIFSTTAAKQRVKLETYGRADRGVSVKHRYWSGTAADANLLFHVDEDVQQKWQESDSGQLNHFAPPEGDVMVIVDHGKGCCSDEMKRVVMRMAHDYGQLVLVDPGHDTRLQDYRGDRTLYKLNAHQAQRLSATCLPTPKIFDWENRQSEETYVELADRVMQSFDKLGLWNNADCLGFLLTLGPGGLLYVPVSGKFLRIKPDTRLPRPVDTCGGGDAVMAALAVGIKLQMLADRDKMSNMLTHVGNYAQTMCARWRWNR